MIPRFLIVIVVVAVAALLVVPMFFATPVADANPSAASTAVGYADITLDVYYRVLDPCVVFNGEVQGCKIGAALGTGFHTDESLTKPTAPASFIDFRPATGLQTTCTARATITISGPGIAGVLTTQADRLFTPDTNVHLVFGHIYFQATGEHEVFVDIYAANCYGLGSSEEHLLDRLPRPFVFDGVDD